MNKTELLKKIDILIGKAKIDEANAENNIETTMYYLGKQNGLLEARLFILELEEK